MILQLGLSNEVIRVTAEYSNAVLVAILPYISDVAQRLDLPVAHPVIAEHVIHCSVLPNRRVEAEIGIEGGWVFAFKFGYVQTIQGPHEFFGIQNFDKIPEYYGEVHMSKSEAIQLGRDTIKKLGIPLESVFAEQEPRVTEPFKIGTNIVPHYRIEWLHPLGVGQAPACVDIDIDGNTKRVERINFAANKNLVRAPPKVDVVPPRDPRFSPRPRVVNPEYARRLIPIVLRAIEEYGQMLSLPLPRPLTTNHVAHFSLQENEGGPYTRIALTNGWRFLYEHNMVTGYEAPDALYGSGDRPILLKDFAGKWNMTEAEAKEVVRSTLAKLEYPTNLVHFEVEPRVSTPVLPGIPRYMFSWHYIPPGGDMVDSAIHAEVDADKGEVKSLYYGGTAFWNGRPEIDVPILLPTPRTTNVAPVESSGRSPFGRPPNRPPSALNTPLPR